MAAANGVSDLSYRGPDTGCFRRMRPCQSGTLGRHQAGPPARSRLLQRSTRRCRRSARPEYRRRSAPTLRLEVPGECLALKLKSPARAAIGPRHPSEPRPTPPPAAPAPCSDGCRERPAQRPCPLNLRQGTFQGIQPCPRDFRRVTRQAPERSKRTSVPDQMPFPRQAASSGRRVGLYAGFCSRSSSRSPGRRPSI